MKRPLKIILHLLPIGLALSLGGCVTQNAPSYGDVARSSSVAPAAAPAFKESRSGLGTSWGEDRRSEVEHSSFSRGSSSRPYSTGKLFYNNESGAQAMADSSGFKWTSRGPVTLAGNTVSVAMTNSSGSYLKSYASGGDRFFVGEDGDRYQIRLKNLTNERIEVVVSVDGLGVLDGKSASVSKRGYLIRPNASLTIEGFRQSDSHVAAFRFGSVSESYAERKHGDSRNVGVIGVAVWTEYGHDPFRYRGSDTWKRRSAQPFGDSNGYATPPSRR